MVNIANMIDKLRLDLEGLNIEIDGTISRLVALNEYLEETFKHEKTKSED